jgi:spore germination protein KC
MNILFMKVLSMIGVLIVLSGCWSSRELTDFGFVMGVSLDQTEEGRIEVNAQIYSPMETIGGSGAGSKAPYTNIKTVNDSVFDAVRDLTQYLGREAQWSHMRVILIGEQFAKEQDIGEILDFFYRDQETRLNSFVIVTKGKAADYWELKPFIERTMGQQLNTIQKMTADISGKTNSAMLLNIATELNSKLKTTMIPYIEKTEEKPEAPFSSGTVIISNGKMVDHLSPGEVQKILMLTNEFKEGAIEFSCMEKQDEEEKKKKETLEVRSVHTKISPEFTNTPPTVHLVTKIEGNIGELNCTSITTKEEGKKVEKHISQKAKKEMEEVIKHLQEKKIDVLGIGNKLYQQDPALWKKWEKDWENMFADTQFVIDVKVMIKNTGMISGKNVTGE